MTTRALVEGLALNRQRRSWSTVNGRKRGVGAVNRCDGGEWMVPSLMVFIFSVKLEVRSLAESEQRSDQAGHFIYLLNEGLLGQALSWVIEIH